jgi:hypothetical protein
MNLILGAVGQGHKSIPEGINVVLNVTYIL